MAIKIELTKDELTSLIVVSEGIAECASAFDKLVLALEIARGEEEDKREWLIKDSSDGAILDRNWNWVVEADDYCYWRREEAREILAESTGNLTMEKVDAD